MPPDRKPKGHRVGASVITVIPSGVQGHKHVYHCGTTRIGQTNQVLKCA